MGTPTPTPTPRITWLTATRAGKLTPSIIGREILVNGIGFGKVSDFVKGPFHTMIYSNGRTRIVRNSAHVVF